MPRAKASHCLRRISQGEPRAPLPLLHSECVAADVSRLKLPPRRNNERTDVRCYDWKLGVGRARHSVRAAVNSPHLFYLFARCNLPRLQEGFDEFALSANGQAGEFLEPFSLRHFRLRCKPVGKCSELPNRDVPGLDAVQQMSIQRSR